MNGYVAITDHDWFRLLASLPRDERDEVNFWTPRPWVGRFGVLSDGQPLLFKLRARHGGFIVGGGFFAHYTKLPISLAWGAFGRKNGVPDLRSFRERIAKLRNGSSDPWDEDPIGCIMLTDPFFFDKEDWIPPPADWKPNIQQGKGYDLTEGIGARLWDDVRARLQPMRRVDGVAELDSANDFRDPSDISGGYAPTAPGRRRIGQGTFKSLILDAYGRQCAVTRERALPGLDAAHIRDYSERPEHDVRNGLLLRSDVHRLFDPAMSQSPRSMRWR